jgi:flagellar basal body-associated protein FliL
MARTIKKKAISDDMLFADNFDESMLDKMENDLDTSFSRDEPEEKTLDYSPDRTQTRTPSGRQGGSMEAGNLMEETGFDHGPDLTDFEYKPDGETSAEPSDDKGSHDKSKTMQAFAGIAQFKKILLIGTALFVIVIAAGLTFVLWPHQTEQDASRVEIVRHQIVIPSFQQEVNFLILSTAPGKKDLLKMDLELDFSSLGSHERFKEKQVLYNDIIYQFLLKQQPPENTVRHWQQILEEGLLTAFQSEHPEIRLNAVHMKNFLRL